MNSWKKIASALMALTMTVSLGTTAFADNGPADDDATTPGTILITNANMSETYNAYKILNATVGNGSTNYSVATGWADFMDTDEAKAVFVFDNTTTPVTVRENKDASADQRMTFAKNAVKYAIDNEIATVGTATRNENDKTVTISGLSEGFYVIDSTMGTVCMLQSAGLVIHEKNVTVPAPEKTQDTSSVTTGVGDTIHYTVKVQVKDGATAYVLHDVMTNLSYNNDATAKVERTNAEVQLNVTTTGLTDGCAFEAEIVGEENLIGETIVITYSADITAAAITEDKVNNTATIHYGNGSTATSTPVEFVLKNADNETINLFLVSAAVAADPDNNVEAQPAVYRPALEGEKVEQYVEAGNAVIKGLKAGQYSLVEEVAPNGYNKLTAPKTVTIGVNESGIADVYNFTGAQLPSTGGIGTTIFYVGGGILIAAAGILLVTKKRMSAAA